MDFTEALLRDAAQKAVGTLQLRTAASPWTWAGRSSA
jgi:hypothetical protein